MLRRGGALRHCTPRGPGPPSPPSPGVAQNRSPLLSPAGGESRKPHGGGGLEPLCGSSCSQRTLDLQLMPSRAEARRRREKAVRRNPPGGGRPRSLCAPPPENRALARRLGGAEGLWSPSSVPLGSLPRSFAPPGPARLRCLEPTRPGNETPAIGGGRRGRRRRGNPGCFPPLWHRRGAAERGTPARWATAVASWGHEKAPFRRPLLLGLLLARAARPERHGQVGGAAERGAPWARGWPPPFRHRGGSGWVASRAGRPSPAQPAFACAQLLQAAASLPVKARAL